jgi:hypothetical protein
MGLRSGGPLCIPSVHEPGFIWWYYMYRTLKINPSLYRVIQMNKKNSKHKIEIPKWHWINNKHYYQIQILIKKKITCGKVCL